MKDDRTLVPAAQQPCNVTTLNGTAVPATSDLTPLRSPVSGTPCVHWRLRIFETVSAGMELVHEMSAPEPMQLAWSAHEGAAPRLVQVSLERARLEAQPTMHHPGSPGARAAAKHFGLSGALRVEEVLIRVGERLQAEGVMIDPSADGGGPFRAHQGPAELVDATLRMETSLNLKPALLPWALGTAAALLGSSGVAAVVAKMYGARVADVPSVIKAELRAPQVVRPRWP